MSKRGPPLTARMKATLKDLVCFCENNKVENFHANMTAPGGRYHVVVTRNPHFVQLLQMLSVHVPDEALSRMLFEDHGIGAPPEGGAGA